jgi:PIN domain
VRTTHQEYDPLDRVTRVEMPGDREVTTSYADVILARTPHLAASAAALDLVGQGKVEGYVAGHAVTTIAYLVQQEKGAGEAKRALLHLLSRIKVAPITDASVRTALAISRTRFTQGPTHGVAAESSQAAARNRRRARRPTSCASSAPSTRYKGSISNR